MEANITLIWFVQPQWFQKMGAFARRENIPVFVEWCETAFKLFGETLPIPFLHMLALARECSYDCEAHTPIMALLVINTWRPASVHSPAMSNRRENLELVGVIPGTGRVG